MRVEVNLQRPPRSERDERCPLVTADDNSIAAPLLGGEHIGEQVPPGSVAVRPGAVEHAPRARSDERVGIDLAVGVGQRHADVFAPVLEAEDLLDVRQRGQRERAVDPGFNDGAHPRGG
jgi:hypothetical protein